jgi:ligand-binding SRPBCC domain-containing protein
MPTREFQTTVTAPLEAVWAFFQDVEKSLPALTSPQEGITIESADAPLKAGSRIVLHMNGPLRRRVRWVARIVGHAPPHAVMFGQEARFVDEQETGPFRSWRHDHEFEALDARTTRVVDRITYRLPFAPIGWLVDVLLVRRKLVAAFRYRHDQLRKRFEAPGWRAGARDPVM